MQHILPHYVARLLITTLISILAFELFGCSPATPPPTATATATLSPTPTFTLTPTMTPTPTLTTTPSPTPCLPPDKLALDPGGEVSVQPGGQLPIRASALNGGSYSWKLSGDGSLSTVTGDVNVYTPSDKSGGLAVITVTGTNVCGTSPAVSLIIHISNYIMSLDKIGIPAGFMTSGTTEPPTKYLGIERVTGVCKTDVCYRFTFKPGNIFAGIMWWPNGCGATGTPNAWAAAKSGGCGIKIFEQKDITPKKLTFWARGENGGEIIEFKVGAGDIMPIPAVSTGPVALGTVWKSYEISLTNVNMDKAAALFTWVAADLGNKPSTIFYLDSVQFEGSR